MAVEGGPNAGLRPVRLDLLCQVTVWAPRVLSRVNLTPHGDVSEKGTGASGHFLSVSTFVLT
jgi:hypothetical protein